MTSRFYTQKSSYINFLSNLIKKLDGNQGLAKKFNIGSSETPILFKVFTLLFRHLYTMNFFIKFMKAFIKLI